MEIFYTSDQHFNHKRIIEYSNRPFSSLEEMNEAIISRHNAIVKSGDIVYYVGDVFFGDVTLAAEIMSRLNGSKYLIKGNHDRRSSVRYLELGFKWVRGHHAIDVGGFNCWMQHHPRQFIPPPSSFQIHGHIHARHRIRGKFVHVGVDAWDYAPASQSELLDLMRKSIS